MGKVLLILTFGLLLLGTDWSNVETTSCIGNFWLEPNPHGTVVNITMNVADDECKLILGTREVSCTQPDSLIEPLKQGILRSNSCASSTDFNTTMTFSLNNSFSASEVSVVCTDICVSLFLSLINPNPPANGSMVFITAHDGRLITYVEFSCNQGFKMVPRGNKTVIALVIGIDNVVQWNGTTAWFTCQPEETNESAGSVIISIVVVFLVVAVIVTLIIISCCCKRFRRLATKPKPDASKQSKTNHSPAMSSSRQENTDNGLPGSSFDRGVKNSGDDDGTDMRERGGSSVGEGCKKQDGPGAFVCSAHENDQPHLIPSSIQDTECPSIKVVALREGTLKID